MSWRVKTRPCPFYNSPPGCIFNDKCNFVHPSHDPRLSSLLKALGDVVPQDRNHESLHDMHTQNVPRTLVQAKVVLQEDQQKPSLRASLLPGQSQTLDDQPVEDDLTIRATPARPVQSELLSPVGSEVSNLPSTPFPLRDSQHAPCWSRDSLNTSWNSPTKLEHSPPRSPSLSLSYDPDLPSVPHPSHPRSLATAVPSEEIILTSCNEFAPLVDAAVTSNMVAYHSPGPDLSATDSATDIFDVEYSISAESSWNMQDGSPTTMYTNCPEPALVSSEASLTDWIHHESTGLNEPDNLSSSSFSAPATPDLSYSSASSSGSQDPPDQFSSESFRHSASEVDPSISQGLSATSETAGTSAPISSLTFDGQHSSNPSPQGDPGNDVTEHDAGHRNVTPGENDTLTSLYDVYYGPDEGRHALSSSRTPLSPDSKLHVSHQATTFVVPSRPSSAASQSLRSRSSSASASTTPSSPASVPSRSSSVKTLTRVSFSFERGPVFTPPPPPLPASVKASAPPMAISLANVDALGFQPQDLSGRKRSGTLTDHDKEAHRSSQREDQLHRSSKKELIAQSSRTELPTTAFGSFVRTTANYGTPTSRQNIHLPHSSPAESTRFELGCVVDDTRAPPASAGLAEIGTAAAQPPFRAYLKPLRLPTVLCSSTASPISSSSRSSIPSSISSSSSSSISSLAMSLTHAVPSSEASLSPELPSTSFIPVNNYDSCAPSSRRSSCTSFSSVPYAPRNSFIPSTQSYQRHPPSSRHDHDLESSPSTFSRDSCTSPSRLAQPALNARNHDEKENGLASMHNKVIRHALPPPLTLHSPPGAQRDSRTPRQHNLPWPASSPRDSLSSPTFYPSHFPANTPSTPDSLHAVATPSPSLLFAIASDSPAAVRDVLEHGGASPNEGLGPQSALAFAATNTRLENRLEIVKLLLAYGADPRSLVSSFSRETGDNRDRVIDERDEVPKEMDVATMYYITRAATSPTWQTSSFIHRSFFRPLMRVRYELIGQDRALEQLFKVLSIHSRKLSVSPIVVLLCGPSGHGKSLLARRFGSLLDIPTHTVNMTTVRSTHDLWRSHSMSPFEEEPSTSTLADFLTANEGKRCIVVLDEIEKSEDEKTLHSLLMPWELGRCSIDAGKPHIDVRNVIWVGTSNIGHDMVFEYNSAREAPEDLMQREDYSQLMSLLRPLVSQRLGASILSRVTTVLPFVPFTRDEKRAIVSEALCTLAGELYRTLSDKTVQSLIDDAVARYLPAEGARSLYRAVSEALVDVI